MHLCTYKVTLIYHTGPIMIGNLQRDNEDLYFSYPQSWSNFTVIGFSCLFVNLSGTNLFRSRSNLVLKHEHPVYPGAHMARRLQAFTVPHGTSYYLMQTGCSHLKQNMTGFASSVKKQPIQQLYFSTRQNK